MSRVDELDVVIRHKGGKVIAGIPQIGLYAKGDDVNVALAALGNVPRFVELGATSVAC